MLTKRGTPSGVPLSTMTVLMLAVFTVSVGYGVVLPLLPYLIERLLGTGGGTAAVPSGQPVACCSTWPRCRASFLLVTVLTVLGFLLSLGLPHQLVVRKRGDIGEARSASAT